jgi:hypothetical protein
LSNILLKAVRLPVFSHGSWWSICPYTGSLFKEDEIDEAAIDSVPDKVDRAIYYCDKPFSLIPANATKLNLEKYFLNRKDQLKVLEKMHTRLINIGNHNFFLSRLYANIPKKIFESTEVAMVAISSLPLQIEGSGKLCLQKSLLAMKTSKTFQEKGVLFIGAFIPTGQMHAWIIEGDMQPDEKDRFWINFRPLLAFYSP